MKLIHTLNRCVVYALILLYAPIVVGAVVGMCYGGYALTRFAFSGIRFPFLPYIVISLDLAILGASLLLLVGLLPLLFRDVTPPSGGFPLKAEEHKALFELLGRFSKRLKVAPPDAVFLSPFDETYIGDFRLVREDNSISKRVRMLSLGAAHVVVLRADEFMTILCHEMAHAAVGDTRYSRIAKRFFNSLRFALELQHDDGDDDYERGFLDFFVCWALSGYYYLFAFFYQADSRWREHRVDAVAARICGPQNVRNALMKTYLPSQIPPLTLNWLFRRICESERDVTNIYNEYRESWKNLPKEVLKQAENAMFLQRSSLWDSHPSLAERMRNVSKIEAKELELDKPATRLFAKWPELETQMTKEVVEWGRELYEQHLQDLDRQLRSNPSAY